MITLYLKPFSLIMFFLITISSCKEKEETNLQLNLSISNVTVSGISSGGYMAHQYHLAFSDQVVGAALYASGPYGCAEGDLQTALTNCLNNQSELDEKTYLAVVNKSIQGKMISNITNLKNDKVWIFHGSKDQTVSENVVQSQARLYQSLGVKVTEVYDVPSGHGLPTFNQGVSCKKTEPPFINACKFDSVGAFFNNIYDDLNPKIIDLKNTGTIVSFNQADYLSKSESNTLADKGFIYLPKNCSAGAKCRVHIAFHGCQQNQKSIGMQFIKKSGHNEWAESNNIVIIYPQTTSSYVPLNPKACWDWWGYTGDGYQTRSGKQMQHVYQMVQGFAKK
jgi:predicted esterase